MPSLLRLPAALGPVSARIAIAALSASLAVGEVAPASCDAANLAPMAAGPARTALESYLAAVGSGRFDRAFALLTQDGRRYFGTAANYASIFAADRLQLERSRIAGATVTSHGVVAVVDETSKYLDASTQTVDEAEGNVLYGVVSEGGSYRIKDPYHPWRAVAIDHAGTTANGLTVTVRKVSFFTGRVEVVVGFQNDGTKAVTILPNRTILRDDRGTVLHCLIDPRVPYTDRQIRLGLRLAANARYTGALAFASTDRYRPGTLELTVGPMLQDEGDEPFSIDLAPLSIPH